MSAWKTSRKSLPKHLQCKRDSVSELSSACETNLWQFWHASVACVMRASHGHKRSYGHAGDRNANVFWGGRKGECFENLINAEKRLDHPFFNVCVFSKTDALTEVTQRSSLRHFGPSSCERRLGKDRSTENQYGCLSDRLNELWLRDDVYVRGKERVNIDEWFLQWQRRLNIHRGLVSFQDLQNEWQDRKPLFRVANGWLVDMILFTWKWRVLTSLSHRPTLQVLTVDVFARFGNSGNGN